MTATILLLGPVAFQDFEVASGIAYGGVQRLAIHQLPGGARVIDALGNDETAITVSGILSGSEATLRARALDAMRVAGAVLPLTWDVFYYSVVVQSFRADYRSRWWIPYSLSCAVLRDEANALISSALSLGAGIAADIAAAALAAPSLDLASVQTAIAAPNAATRGTADYLAAQTGLTAAGSSLRSAMSAAEATLPATALFSAGGAASGAASLATATAAAQSLASLTQANAYLGRTAANLANAST